MELVKKRIWFSEADDLALLKEVLGHLPFINTTEWNVVASNMTLLTGKNIKLRAVRDRMKLLIKTWLERKKTCEEKLESIDYTEKDTLCREIYNLMKENKTKKDREVETGLSSRDSWTKTAFNPVEHIIYNNDHQSDLDIKDENIIINVSENEDDISEINEANLSSEEAYSRTRYDSLRKETSSPTANSSRVANPNKAKKRRAIQKQGLEEYDKIQFELKKGDQELEARRLLLEEKKVMLEERRLKLEEKKIEIENKELEERRLLLEEKRIMLEERRLKLEEKKIEIEKMEKMKNLEILEKKIELEREDREERRKLNYNSDNIIQILLKRLEKP